jgi:hypothetical protein
MAIVSQLHPKLLVLGCREEALFNEPLASGHWTEDFLENARSFAKAVFQFAQLKTLKIYVPIEQNPQPPRFDNFVQGDDIYKLIANRFFGIPMSAAEEEGKECMINTISFVDQEQVVSDTRLYRNEYCETHTFTF